MGTKGKISLGDHLHGIVLMQYKFITQYYGLNAGTCNLQCFKTFDQSVAGRHKVWSNQIQSMVYFEKNYDIGMIL